MDATSTPSPESHFSTTPTAFPEPPPIEPKPPTLRDLWPRLTPPARTHALRSLGALLRRAHAVALPGHGPLPAALTSATPLQWFLAEELGVRLFPAVADRWPAGLGTVEGLLETIPEIVARTDDRAPVLVRGAFRAEHVLCEPAGDVVECVAFADTDGAFGGPPDADVAGAELMIVSPLGDGLDGASVAAFLDGYAARPDAVVVAFFRARRLVQLGLDAAARGLARRAGEAFEAAAADMERVHSRYRQRVYAAARSAGMHAAEAAALVPSGIQERRRPAAKRAPTQER